MAFYLRTVPELCTLDVQPTIARMHPTKEEVLMTLLPSSKVVLLKQRRILLGFEALRLQGFPESALRDYVLKYGAGSKHVELDPFFLDLAGNAWAGPIMCSIIAAILCRSPRQLVARFALKAPAQASCSAAPSGASSDDADVMDSILAM